MTLAPHSAGEPRPDKPAEGTARTRRAERRAAARARTRTILDDVADRHDVAQTCLIHGCERPGVPIRYCELVITFCPEHELAHERAYRRRARAQAQRLQSA